MNSMAKVFFYSSFIFLLTVCSDNYNEAGALSESQDNPSIQETPDSDTDTDPTPACLKTLYVDHIQPIFINQNCKKANQTQRDLVEQGNLKKDLFLAQCYSETNNSCWCDQLIRPNPKSFDTFECTYGNGQIHQLINPDEDTWAHAFEAVKIVEEFEEENILTQIIYNWWRPEPYNKNVGGASGRHPHGTSIDIRFETKDMQNIAFSRLCKMRKAGRIRAIGYYASTAIHLGIGDSRANTWGKDCP